MRDEWPVVYPPVIYPPGGAAGAILVIGVIVIAYFAWQSWRGRKR